MTINDFLNIATRLSLVGLVCLTAGFSPAAEEESDDPVLQMVVDLLGNEDRDMRAIGLQQVREGLPGEAATKKLVEMLGQLPPEGQAGLVEALGERGDATARPAIVQMLESQEGSVRTAALQALGGLGTPADVPLLAQKAARGTKSEKDAARRGLIRLRGEGINGAIVAAMTNADSAVSVELLGALALRNATETLPKVLESAKAPEPAVRSAALEALRFLAGADNAVAIVNILETAEDPSQRQKAELALLSVSNRDPQKTAEAVVARLADADPASRVSLLHVLARSGGQKALDAVVGQLAADDESVRDEAVRMLSIWPDPAAAGHLLKIAKSSQSLRHQVLAIRGLVNLASPTEDKPADVKMLTEAMNLAKRPAEKLLVIGVLGGTATAQSLAVVAPAVDDSALADEAGLAAVMIAEKIEGGDKDQIRSTLKKVSEQVENEQIRRRALDVLKSLGQ